MKKQALILAIGAAIIGLMSSCASIDTNDNSYYGYNNKPKYEKQAEPQYDYAASRQTATQEQSSLADNSEPETDSYYADRPQERVIEPSYAYFSPITYYGYYPWWAAPRPFRVVEPYRPGISISVGFSNYDYWDYYWFYYHYRPVYPYVYYDPYCYGSVYYPYPYYYPYYYPRYYGSGWYVSPKHHNTYPDRAEKDTYRDFGPSRGSYGSGGTQTEISAPANRRSGAEQVPATNSGAKTIFDNNSSPRGNVRTPQNPTKETINSTPTTSPTSPRSTRSSVGSPDAKPAESPAPTRSNISSPNQEQPRATERRDVIRSEQPSSTGSKGQSPAPRYEPRNEAPRRETPAPSRSYEPSRRESVSPAPRSVPSGEQSSPSRNSGNSQPSNKRTR